MAKVVKRKPSEVKDALLEHISRDIKALQKQQCDVNAIVDVVTSENQEAQSLCEHLEQIFMHGLYRLDLGYWPFVSAFTRRDAVRSLRSLESVKTSTGRGRAWLALALNEQSLESYLRIFMENQDGVLEYYTMDAFLRDYERMTVLVTLVTGLDFMMFDLTYNAKYLDLAPSAYTEYGVPHVRGTDLGIQPSFVSAQTIETTRKQDVFRRANQHAPGTPPTILSESRSGPPLEPSLASVVMLDGAVVTLEGPSQQSPTILDRFSQAEAGILVQHQRAKGKRKKKKHRFAETGINEQQFEESIDQSENSKGLLSQPAQPFRLPRVGSVKAETGSIMAETKSVEPQYEAHEPEAGFVEIQHGDQKPASGAGSTEPQHKDQKPKGGAGSAEPQHGDHKFETKSVEPRHGDRKPEAETGSFKPQHGDGSVEPQHGGYKPESGSVEPQHGDLKPESGSVETQDGDWQPQAEPVQLETRASNSYLEPDFSSADMTTSTRTEDASDSCGDSASIKERETVSARRDASLLERDAETSLSSYQSLETSLGASYSTSTVDTGSSTVQEPSSEEDLTLPANLGRKRSGAVSAIQKLVEDYSIIESGGNSAREEPSSLAVTGESTKLLYAVRKRPVLNEEEGHRADMVVSDNVRLILSLEVFFDPEETINRLVKVRIPVGLGRYQLAGLVVTSAAVYLTQCDGGEAEFNRIVGMNYPRILEMVVGQSWQLLELVYSEAEYSRKPLKQVVVTGNEAVSRSIAKSIRISASEARPYSLNIPIIKDEGRGAMMSLELSKLSSSEPQAEILRYSLVHWEQLMGEPPRVDTPGKDRDTLSGSLQVKESSLFGKGWKVAYFSLIDGVLHHYNTEFDKNSKGAYPLRGLKCGGCMRARGESKPFAFNVLDSNGSSLTLAASSEEQMTVWMQALCMAASGVKEVSTLSLQQGGLDCGVLLTNDRVNVLVEDMTNKSVQLVTSILVEEVTEIGVDRDFPLYCVLVYEDQKAENKGMWMLNFSSEFELGQFEQALATRWKDIYQVDIQFSEMLDPAIKARAKRALELFLTPRSDSITRGRTEFFP